MAGLFGGAASTTSAVATASAPTPATPRAPAAAEASNAPADTDGLIAAAARDLADYQRLTAEGKLGEAGRRLEELKQKLDRLNSPRK